MAKKQNTTRVSDALRRLMALFEGFHGAHGTHGVPERDAEGLKWNIKRTARTLREPVTPELWQQHVEGKRPLGVIPIREDSSCSWGSIDVDVYDADLIKMVRDVEATKFPLVPCVSKSGGLHLFLFLEKPEPAADVQNALRDAAASLGLADCEIFPKQQRVLKAQGDLGNWMVMPYFGSTYDGKLRLQQGLKRTGSEMTMTEFVTAAERSRTTIEKFLELARERRAVAASVASSPGSGGSRRGGKSKGDFSDGPPCIQYLISSGPQADGRKRLLFMMALYYKRVDGTGWKQRVEQANQQYFKPPLPADEVTGIQRSLDKKDYEYTCKEEPMRSYCNSTLCRMRKFGVGKGGEYPTISNLSKMETDPPLWFADVEGHRLELTTDELQNYTKFHRACMEKVDKCYRMMKQDTWLSILAEAMQDINKIEAPPEIGRKGSFLEMLREFLLNRYRANNREEVQTGKPYEEDGKFYFRAKDLKKFLEQEGMRIEQNVMYKYVFDLRGGQGQWQLGGPRGHVRFLWVPSSAIEQLPAIPAPKMEERDII